MDEVGFIVSHIEDNGMLRVIPLGGIDPKLFYGQRLTIWGKEKVESTVAAIPPHISDKNSSGSIPVDDCLIDTGISPNKIKKIISIGDQVTFSTECVIDNQRILSKSLDDRIGLYVMLETIKKINDLTYKQMQKDKKEGPSQGDPITINGKKGAITHSSVYGKTPKTTKSKVVDTYDTGRKDTKSKNLNPWGRSKQYKAKDGTVVDRSDVFTKAAFDFGPNIKKGEKIGVIGHGQRKKYDLEATRRKSVKESVAVAKQLPKAFKAASKLKNVAKSGAIQKVFGGASALTGLSGMVHQSKKDSIPDINSDAPPDIQKQLDAPQDVRPRSRGEKILKDLLGTKKDPKAMKDKYDKDALDNAKTDSILDPSGTQKTKPTLDQLRKDVKTRKKYKTKSPEIERNQGTMTDKQIERMKKAGLL